MKRNNRNLAVFLVPNGQGGFRRESYSLRKEVGSSVSSGANYTYPRFGGARRGFEGKVAKNSIQYRGLIYPPLTVLDDIDSYFLDFPDDDI